MLHLVQADARTAGIFSRRHMSDSHAAPSTSQRAIVSICGDPCPPPSIGALAGRTRRVRWCADLEAPCFFFRDDAVGLLCMPATRADAPLQALRVGKLTSTACLRQDLSPPDRPPNVMAE